jgi:predicted helicase
LNWTDTVKRDCAKGKLFNFDSECIRDGLYRPYFRQKVYFNNNLNHRIYQQRKLFPTSQIKNRVICVTGMGANKDFSALICNIIPNLDTLEKAQCFPLYWYEEREKNALSLFDDPNETEHIRRDGISDFILRRSKIQYGKNVNKEDIFYYIYGILHSEDYRNTFANDLKKMLPRIPLVEDVRDFWKFSKAGRVLADLHINYESVPPYDGVQIIGADCDFYKVEKMRFPQKGQQDTIIFNSKIVVSNIPAKAYEYVVNGKSAIEWIMERYQVSIHKNSGIKNDPNDWAEEIGNPRYILDLLLSIINVSVQTVTLVKSLPKLKFE